MYTLGGHKTGQDHHHGGGGGETHTAIHHILNEDEDDDEDDVSGQHLGDFDDQDDYETEDSVDDDHHSFDSFGLSSRNHDSPATKSPIFRTYFRSVKAI